MPDITVHPSSPLVDKALVAALRRHAEPLPPPHRAEEFGASFDRFGDASLVMLGEATHGTS